MSEPMKPGRELDKLVALVFGWKEWEFGNPGRDGQEAFRYKTLVPPEYDGSDLQHLSMIIPYYSTDMRAAWRAWEWLEQYYTTGGVCLVRGLDSAPSVITLDRGCLDNTLATGESYPHAIALAVLATRAANAK